MKKRIWLRVYVLAVCSIAVSVRSAPPDRWWTRSSLTLPEQEKPLLWHVEIAGGAEYLNGNESGNAFKGRWLGVVRHRRVSAYLDGNVDSQDKDYGQMGSVRQISYMARGTLRYDLYKEFYTSAGVVTERDDTAFIARRDSLFWGIGQQMTLPANVELILFGAYGRERSHYDETMAGHFGVAETSEPASAVILSQQLRWQANPQVALSQDGMLVMYVDGGQEDRWQIGGGPEFTLLPNLSLLVRYEARIEDNPVLQAISGETLNEKVTVMLKLSY